MSVTTARYWDALLLSSEMASSPDAVTADPNPPSDRTSSTIAWISWSSSTTRTLTTSSNSLSPAAAVQSSGGVRDAGMIGSEIMFKSEPRPEDYGLTLPDFMAASTSSASRLRCLWSRSNISRLVTSVARSRISAASAASLRSFSREAW